MPFPSPASLVLSPTLQTIFDSRPDVKLIETSLEYMNFLVAGGGNHHFIGYVLLIAMGHGMLNAFREKSQTKSLRSGKMPAIYDGFFFKRSKKFCAPRF